MRHTDVEGVAGNPQKGIRFVRSIVCLCDVCRLTAFTYHLMADDFDNASSNQSNDKTK